MNDKSERRKGWQQLFTVVLLVGLALTLVPAPLAHAATITVTTTADELNNNGQCSLREAITNASANDQSGSTDCAAGTGNDTITFDFSGTITLGSELTITDAAELTITGPAGGITISGDNAVRVFLVNSGAITLRNLTVANGSATEGGGIANGGTLTVTHCIFSGNAASGTFSSSGGGSIRNTGTLTVLDSTFSGNSATIGGGGIQNFWGTLTVLDSTFSSNSAADGGGILNYGADSTATVTNSTFSGNPVTEVGGGVCNIAGVLVVTNCTFSGNSATITGGGIYNDGTLTVTNSTFSGNSATGGGGGVRNSSPGTTTLRNSIVANSTAGGNCDGAITNGGNNIDSGTSCGWGSSDGSLSNTDPQLGPLADNGGPTQTFALLAGSRAIDAVTYNAPNGCPTTDQRGYFRPVDGDDNGSALCDIGAFEYGSHPGFLIYLPLVLRGS
jgi:CSLREA domain-containing protein